MAQLESAEMKHSTNTKASKQSHGGGSRHLTPTFYYRRTFSISTSACLFSDLGPFPARASRLLSPRGCVRDLCETVATPQLDERPMLPHRRRVRCSEIFGLNLFRVMVKCNANATQQFEALPSRLIIGAQDVN